jgi:putative SOS response-associated peptidase YedK
VCGRFAQQRPSSELAEIFGAEDLAGDAGGRYNVAPTDEASVVVQREDRRAVVAYRWGLQPAWMDPKRAARAFNARAETLATSGLFRDAYRKRRCLVPVDGFYEWRREGSRKVPMWVHGPDGKPLALAGLWTGRQDEETGEWLRTFTIITSAPNAFMAGIHDRMPVVIAPGAWSAWLDPVAKDPGELRALLEPDDGLPLAAHVVAPLVNNARNDGPSLILPVEDPAALL